MPSEPPRATRFFVGTGVEGIRPPGYTTIDISDAGAPDIVADASDLHMIADGCADEFYASHVLEHVAWPRAVLVLAEWARVLRVGGVIKLAVPDMELLGALLAEGQNPWHVIELIYGAHWATPGGPQGHHFGYTKRTLTQLLGVLGFGEFDWWSSELPEAANGWLYADNGEQVAISVNIAGTKLREPLIDPARLVAELRHRITEPFPRVVRDVCSEAADLPAAERVDALLLQRLHMKLVEERQRVNHYKEQAARRAEGAA